ncbi:MAG: hypothetical protein LBS75_01550 [Synergistaceae bacterium]|jgi:hypothetical protein|nr:hypothetical protein [Synergistaceae bacterium]
MADSSSARKTAAASQPRGKQQKPSEQRIKSLLFIIALVACCAGSYYFYMTTLRLIEDGGNAVRRFTNQQVPPDSTLADETKAIDTVESGLSDITKATSMSMQTALLAEISGKYPVAPSNRIMPAPSTGAAASDLAEIEPDPPMVTVVAILIKGDDKIAMLDVAGEEGALIVRQGSKFSSGTARVTKIDAKGVTYTWMKKSIQVPF